MLPPRFELRVYPERGRVFAHMVGASVGGLDFPGVGQAAWAMYDRTGVRPEYVLPVLWSESGFNPAATNSIGCVGINQACPFAIPTPPDYTSWAASAQWTQVVTPMYVAIVDRYGPIRSGTLAYLANFLPAKLAPGRPRSLSTVLATKGSAVYDENAGFDTQKKGTITIGDLGAAVARAASHSMVQAAIAETYKLRPGESPKNSAYGSDYPWYVRHPILGVISAIAAAAAAAGGGVALAMRR